MSHRSAAAPGHLGLVYGRFWTETAELSGCNGNHSAQSRNCYVELYRKGCTVPGCQCGFGLKEKVKVKVTQSCPTLCNPVDYTVRNSPSHSFGVGSLSLLQGIFQTQGLNSESPTLQGDSLPAEPPGKPTARFSKHVIPGWCVGTDP